jgi:hypothetical protein
MTNLEMTNFVRTVAAEDNSTASIFKARAKGDTEP